MSRKILNMLKHDNVVSVDLLNQHKNLILSNSRRFYNLIFYLTNICPGYKQFYNIDNRIINICNLIDLGVRVKFDEYILQHLLADNYSKFFIFKYYIQNDIYNNYVINKLFKYTFQESALFDIRIAAMKKWKTPIFEIVLKNNSSKELFDKYFELYGIDEECLIPLLHFEYYDKIVNYITDKNIILKHDFIYEAFYSPTDMFEFFLKKSIEREIKIAFNKILDKYIFLNISIKNIISDKLYNHLGLMVKYGATAKREMYYDDYCCKSKICSDNKLILLSRVKQMMINNTKNESENEEEN